MKQCKQCNKTFESTGNNHVHCTNDCKTKYKDAKAYERYKIDTDEAKNKRGKDLTGQKLNKLTILKRVGSSRNGLKLWQCRCDCGNEKTYSSDHLTRKIQPVKSCGCLYTIGVADALIGHNHPAWTGCGEISGSWWTDHVVRSADGSKGRDRLELTITIDYIWELFIKQDRKCALSGLILEIKTKSNNTASLDRIDSASGYIPGNVQWTHKHINLMKNKFTQDYFIELCKLVATHS